MNANELADDLDYASTVSEPRIQMMGRMRIAATMLRQQQAEIEALKLQVKGYQTSTKYYRELHEGFSTIANQVYDPKKHGAE